MGVHARGQAQLGVTDEGVGGERDDGNAAGLTERVFPGADGARGGVAIHHRHLAVHQHEVKAAALHGLIGECTVGDDLELAANGFEHVARHHLVDAVVFGQQHARTQGGQHGPGAGGRGGRAIVVAGGLGQRAKELLPAHRLGQVATDAHATRTRQLVGRVQRGHHHRAQRAQLGVVAHGRSQRDAIHQWHLHVDDGEVEGVTFGHRLAHARQAGDAVTGTGAAHARHQHVVLEDFAVGGVVIDDDDVAALQDAGVRGRWQ